jgi:catechol 2,3-dioxygenase-like lactoylglutathione lyase family enzyme
LNLQRSQRSSFHTTICVLEGLLAYERAGRKSVAVTKARKRGENYLLKRRLFRSLRTGEVIDERWLRFSFPTFWHYDVLRGLDYMRDAGIELDRGVREAIEVVAQRRHQNGRWPLNLLHRERVPLEMEIAIGSASRWNTLRALRILRGTTSQRRSCDLDQRRAASLRSWLTRGSAATDLRRSAFAQIEQMEHKNMKPKNTTLQRMDHVGIVVDDLAAAIAFFVELGLELEGEAPVEGRWVDRVVGLDGVRVDIAMMRTPDGHGRLELTKFHRPTGVSTEPRNAPANTLGIRRIMFAVRDIDGVLARLQAHGAELVGELAQYEDKYRLCYVRGPEGIIIALAEQLS